MTYLGTSELIKINFNKIKVNMNSSKNSKINLHFILKTFLFLNIIISFIWAYNEDFKTFEPIVNFLATVIALLYEYKNADSKKSDSYLVIKRDINKISPKLQKIDKETLEAYLSIFLFFFFSILFFYVLVYENPWYHDVFYRIYHSFLLAIIFPYFISTFLADKIVSRLYE